MLFKIIAKYFHTPLSNITFIQCELVPKYHKSRHVNTGFLISQNAYLIEMDYTMILSVI